MAFPEPEPSCVSREVQMDSCGAPRTVWACPRHTVIDIGFWPHGSPVSHRLGSTDSRVGNPEWMAFKSSILTQHGAALRRVTWLQ